MSPVMGESIRRRRRSGSAGQRATPSRAKGTGSRIRWGRWLLATLVSGAAAFGAGWLVAVYVIFPPPPPPEDTVAVPSLVGRALSDAERLLSEAGLVLEATSEFPHATEPRGIVVAQSPLEGQQLRPGSGVRLAVSSGPRRARIPDLTGLPETAAVPLLTRAGFEVVVENEYVPGAPLGQVLRSEPAPGGEFTLPIEVTVYVTADSLTVFGDSLGIVFDSLGFPVVPADSGGEGGVR